MLDPTICKLVLVDVLPREGYAQYGVYKGHKIVIADFQEKPIGRRRMYLKYSIINDEYYLKSK